MDTGVEVIEDEAEKVAIRNQAQKVLRQSAVLAAAATIIALVIR